MNLHLLPYPKHSSQAGGTWTLPDEDHISLANHPAELLATAQRIQQAAGAHSILHINGGALPAAITLTVDNTLPFKAESYRLVIDSDGVRIIGGGEFKAKLSITAAGASKPAIAAVEKAGGSITLPAPKDSEA